MARTASTKSVQVDDDEQSRKRRRLVDDGDTDPTAAAAAAIQQKDWGIAEVLAECGATLTSAPLPKGIQENSNMTSGGGRLGCLLDSTVTPAVLRASIHTLLKEMDRSGIDPDNARVIESLEEMITSGVVAATTGGGSNDGNAAAAAAAAAASSGGKHALLKRMLLPTYRIVPANGGNSSSARSAVTDKENVGNVAGEEEECVTPRPGNQKNAAAEAAGSPTKPNSSSSAAKMIQTFESSSLVRTLLRVDALQPTLLTALLQKLPEFASDDDDDDDQQMEVDPDETQDTSGIMPSADATSNDDADAKAARAEIPRLILSQIRWLDHVVDATTLTEASLEVLSLLTSSASPELTRPIVLDLIATLPDIVDETKTEQIDRIVSTLTDVRIEDTTLLIPCLDALSSLRLTADQLRGVTSDALGSLQSAEIWSLPALCKFLVQNAPADMCKEVIEALREMRLGGTDDDGDEVMQDASNADGRPGSGGGGRRRRRRGGASGGNSNDGNGNSRVLHRSDAECLMLESFAQGMQYRPDLSSALISSIKSTPPSNHLSSDIWLLLCCAVAPHNKSQVKSIFRSKATSGGFTPELLTDAIRGNGRALSHLFSSSALDLADGLVRSPEAEARGLGGVLYAELFDEFSEPMQRQEVVGSLVTHVASGGNSDEIDSAMKVFSRLVEGRTSASSDSDGAQAMAESSLRSFRPYLTSLLDHVRSMSPSQLRRLFLVLFTVGGNDDDGDDDVIGGPRKVGMGGCDDVQIVIRKYLSLPSIRLKRIGIIGAVAYAVTSSSNVAAESEDPEETCMEGDDGQDAQLSAVAKDIISMLDQARTSCTAAVQNSDWFGGSSMDGEETGGDTALAHLFDELCLAVRGGRLAAPVKDWILENFSEALEDMFLGDLTDPSESEPSETDSQAIIDNPADRAIVAGTSGNPRAPRGAMRFNIDGDDALVYVKFLSLAASSDSAKRNSLAQLGPLLRLLATCHDVRYGGLGLTEIDAVIGCPLFLPTAENCSCEGFGHLSPDEQLSTATSCFFAASWCRELVNTFIYSAAFPPAVDAEGGTAAGEESQIATTPEEIRRKLVEKLKALIEIQDDLIYTSSMAPQFTPPGLAPLRQSKELVEVRNFVEDDSSSDEDDDLPSESNAKLSKEEKEAVIAQRNAVKKKAAAKEKAKDKLKKLKKKFEASLSERSVGALRPLSSLACLALGFPECSIVHTGHDMSQAMSMCADEIRKFKVGGKLMTLLFTQLQSSIDSLFPKRKMAWLKSCAGDTTIDDESIDNPYILQTPSSNTKERVSGGDAGYKTLDDFLSGHVFVSLYEHLATIAEIRGGGGNESDDNEDEVDKNSDDLKECTTLIFACLCSTLDAETLTSSARGRKYLEQVMKQVSLGDRDVSYNANDRKQVSLPGLRKAFADTSKILEEILMGGETDDLAFIMGGVECLEAMLRCALRVEIAVGNKKDGEEEPQGIQDLRKSLSTTCHKLLKRKWSENAKYNKSTVGKLVTLYVENSCTTIPSDSDKAAQADVSSLGRLEAITVVVRDILGELPNTQECKGPVDAYPTCSYQSFGSLFSAVLNFLPRELAFVFDSSLSNSTKTVEKTLEYTLRLLELLNNLFELTKENSKLAKRPFLLSQLRAGTTFLQTFNSKAVKFLECHFTDNENTTLQIIKLVQTMTRQMSNVITHGKREKDANLIKETPRAKKVLETFLHKIKRLMRKNNCVTALWGGNLKEKNIDGSVVEEAQDSEDEDDDGEDEDGEEEEGSGEDDDSSDSDDYETDED